MFSNILGFVKGLLPSFSKSDIETDIEISIESIATINQVWGNMESILQTDKLKSDKSKKIVDEFYKEMKKTKCKVKLSSNKNIGADIIKLYKNVEPNAKWVLDKVSDSMNDVIVSQALTAWNANLLRAGGHLYFMTRYTLDLSNYLYTCEVQNSKMDVSKEFLLNKKQLESIEKKMWIFVKLISVYGDEDKEFRGRVESLGNVVINKDTADQVADGYDPKDLDIVDSLPNGFVGSPIYAIRMMFAQWEADRYKHIKDKKKLLELRYLHLRTLKERGETDVAMEKEINYLQKAVTDMDYKLSKIEESIE